MLIEAIKRKSRHEVFRLRVLIDLYQEADFTVRRSYRNTLDYLERRRLITLEDNTWIITEAGVQLIEKTFPLILLDKKLDRPPDLLPEYYRAY